MTINNSSLDLGLAATICDGLNRHVSLFFVIVHVDHAWLCPGTPYVAGSTFSPNEPSVETLVQVAELEVRAAGET